MTPLARKVSLVGGGFLLVLLLAGLPGLGQGVTDPSGELADAECYSHHKQEGFRSMDMFPKLLDEVPKGQPFEVELTIRNPWLHELQDLSAYVDVTNAPGVALEGGAAPEEKHLNETIAGGPTGYTPKQYSLPVAPNATEIYVHVGGNPGTAPPAYRVRDMKNDFDITLTSPDGSIVITGPDPSDPTADILRDETPVSWDEVVHVDQKNLSQAGPGEWTLTVSYRGFENPAPYALDYGIYYNVTGIIILPGPDLLEANEQHTFRFTLLARDVDGLQRVRYGGIGVAYHEHTDQNTGDIGHYDKWSTMEFQTGSTLRISNSGTAVVGGSADTLSPILRRWSQVLGFTGSFLLVPSLVFGGTFGKTSVVKLNELFGGPRRRVLFHNSMSFWLLGVSVLHLFLVLIETQWGWSKGLVWGGLSLACMIGLGVTGATQKSFVARWGFTRWRFIHFAMGILVVAFVLVHMTADGSHLAPIRQSWFGAEK